MKSIVFLMSIFNFLFVSHLNSQESLKIKKTTYGFSTSLNYSNLSILSKQGFEYDTKNSFGYEVGLLMERRFSSFAFLSPRVNLSFNNVRFKEVNGNVTTNNFKVMPLRLDFMMYAIFRDQKHKLQPYFFFGPSIKTPINKVNGIEQYSLVTDIGVDFGIGLNKVFPNVQFSPELKYSFGLMNLSRNQGVNNMKLHMLSLVFNIKNK